MWWKIDTVTRTQLLNNRITIKRSKLHNRPEKISVRTEVDYDKTQCVIFIVLVEWDVQKILHSLTILLWRTESIGVSPMDSKQKKKKNFLT